MNEINLDEIEKSASTTIERWIRRLERGADNVQVRRVFIARGKVAARHRRKIDA